MENYKEIYVYQRGGVEFLTPSLMIAYKRGDIDTDILTIKVYSK